MFCPETSIRRAKTHNTLIYNKLHNQPQNSECKEILHLCKVVLQSAAKDESPGFFKPAIIIAGGAKKLMKFDYIWRLKKKQTKITHKYVTY